MQEDITKRAKRARRAAELAAADEITRWYSGEKAKVEAIEDEDERDAAKRALLFEFGRRSRSALAKAKRDNTAPKLLMRDAQAEIDRRRNGRADPTSR